MKLKLESEHIKNLNNNEFISQVNSWFQNNKSFTSNKLTIYDKYGFESYDFPNKILKNQRKILRTEIAILNNLDKINSTNNELKNGPLYNNQFPKCLHHYIEKADDVSKIKIKSIISQLQYHLGILVSPGTNNEIKPFKEGGVYTPGRKRSYTVKALKHFISLDNHENALVAISMNSGVRECICQLAVHKHLGTDNKVRCIDLLLAYEHRFFSEVYSTHLSMYQLEKMEQMFISQQEQINELKHQCSQMLSILKDIQQDKANNQERITPKQNRFANRNVLFPVIIDEKEKSVSKEALSEIKKLSSSF